MGCPHAEAQAPWSMNSHFIVSSYVDTIFEKLIEINRSGTSILLVEQNAHMALQVAHRGYIFKIGEDTGKNLLEREEVKKAFLGG
jgi:branched-chain amino acid transport system ATP-binding protein